MSFFTNGGAVGVIVATKTMAQSGRDWRIACEDGNMAALYAALEADLSVAPVLASTIPNYLEVVSPDAGLPQLPRFNINPHLPPTGTNAIAVELAGHIREQLGSRFERVAQAAPTPKGAHHQNT